MGRICCFRLLCMEESVVDLGVMQTQRNQEGVLELCVLHLCTVFVASSKICSRGFLVGQDKRVVLLRGSNLEDCLVGHKSTIMVGMNGLQCAPKCQR